MTLPILGRRLTAGVSCGADVLDGAEIMRRAQGAAGELAGVDRVAVDDPDPLHRLCWLLGADLAGAATLIVDPDWPRPQDVLDEAKPGRVVRGLPIPGEPPETPRDDELTWFYLPTTSGSSGTPKVLARSRKSWLRSFTALDAPLRDDDSALIPGPLSSSLYLFGALHALHQDRDVRLLRRWSARTAAQECLHATVVHVVPAMLAELLSVWERHPELRDSCALRLIVCGGADLAPELETRLHALLPGCELLAHYGSAETSLIALRRGERRLRPVVDVEILDAQGNPASEGELRVRSELAFDGYLRQGVLEAPESDRISVGDRAVRHDDGGLSVLGRCSATISTGGTLVAAEEVESALRGRGVREVLVAGTPHTRLGALVTAVVEVDPAAPATREELRARVREPEPVKRPRRWLTVPELPRTGSGKPARGVLDEWLRNGAPQAEVLHPSTPSQERP